MGTLYHSPLFVHVREYFRASHPDDTIFLFVPYIKTSVLESLLEGIPNKMVIVTTWEPRDIQVGSSELSLYPFCQRHGITLYVSSGLHLKVYSVGLVSAILGTGNVSRRGLLPDGNYEAAAKLDRLTIADQLFFERIRMNARLVDDIMYEELVEWNKSNPSSLPKPPALSNVITSNSKDNFSVSALPMTRSVNELIIGYTRICAGGEPSEDPETAACIIHDLVNYNIESDLSEDEFRDVLSDRFFAHPFILRMDELINQGAHFGRIKKWIQDNCTDVPVPSRRELTGNVQVLLEWFVSLGKGRYVKDIPGKHSERLRKI